MKKILLILMVLLIYASSVSAGGWCIEGQTKTWDYEIGDWVYGPEEWIEVDPGDIEDNNGDVGLAGFDSLGRHFDVPEGDENHRVIKTGLYELCDNLYGGQCGQLCTANIGDCNCCIPPAYPGSACLTQTPYCDEEGACVQMVNDGNTWDYREDMGCECDPFASGPEFNSYAGIIAIIVVVAAAVLLIKNKK
jgi:hypothetical protein